MTIPGRNVTVVTVCTVDELSKTERNCSEENLPLELEVGVELLDKIGVVPLVELALVRKSLGSIELVNQLAFDHNTSAASLVITFKANVNVRNTDSR